MGPSGSSPSERKGYAPTTRWDVPRALATMAKKRLVKVYSADDIRFAGDRTASTTVYAPSGTTIEKGDVGRIRRLVRAFGSAVRGWDIESVSIGLPPFVVKVRPKKK